MEVINRKISELKEADYNPRKISPEAFAQLKASLDNFECVEPAIININSERLNIIIGGHQRIKAAKSLKWKTFPCIEVDLSLEREKELNIRLNKNTGEFDFDLLNSSFAVEDLISWGFDKEDFNLGIEEVALPDISSAGKDPYQNLTFTLHDKQAAILVEALNQYKTSEAAKEQDNYGNLNGNGNALFGIVQDWLLGV